ncbi:hypothetical protein ON010_g13236 [Phytophthora cinnamomi]|nr:hypothetical protein ON010_g13236 [Phytophthora cinnamomi]
MSVQIEVLDYLRPEQGEHVGRPGELEPGEDLLGHGCPSDHVPLFQHADALPSLAIAITLVRCSHEPVVAAPDDDGVPDVNNPLDTAWALSKGSLRAHHFFRSKAAAAFIPPGCHGLLRAAWRIAE